MIEKSKRFRVEFEVRGLDIDTLAAIIYDAFKARVCTFGPLQIHILEPEAEP